MTDNSEATGFLVPDIVEDFTLSDVEEDTAIFNKKAINIDINNRIVENLVPSFDGKRPTDGESCVIRYNNVDGTFQDKSSESPSTSSEDLEMSDDEGCPASAINIHFTTENSHISIKSNYPSKVLGDTHANETKSINSYYYEDSSIQEPILTNRKRSKKNMFNFYEAFAEQDKKVSPSEQKLSTKTWKVSDNEMLVTDDDDVFLPENCILKTSNSQLEFIDMDSEENSTDTEDIILNKAVSDDCLENITAKKKRAVYANSLPVKQNSNKAETSNDLTDDEALSDIDESMRHHRIYKDHLLKVDMTDDNEHTEEEDLYDDINTVRSISNKNRQKQEWTETDESGNVQHIKIKTETSIKVGGGDEGESGDEDVVSRRTTTSTRIVTTVTTGEGGTEEGEGGNELRSSMEAVLSQFMSDDDAQSHDSSSKKE